MNDYCTFKGKEKIGQCAVIMCSVFTFSSPFLLVCSFACRISRPANEPGWPVHCASTRVAIGLFGEQGGNEPNQPNQTTHLHPYGGGALHRLFVLLFIVGHHGRVTERLIVSIHIERTRSTEPAERDFVVLLFRGEGDRRPLDGR